MTESTATPLSANFPRFHAICDCCGAPANWGTRQAVRGEFATAAGAFKYQICIACDRAMDELSEADSLAARLDAAVRHAEFYSQAYGEFVAAWFGLLPIQQAVAA